jgi:hypothetical protein
LADSASVDFSILWSVVSDSLAPALRDIFNRTFTNNWYKARFAHSDFLNFDREVRKSYSLIVDLMKLRVNTTLKCGSYFSGGTAPEVTYTFSNLTNNLTQCSNDAEDLFQWNIFPGSNITKFFDRVVTNVNETFSNYTTCFKNLTLSNLTNCLTQVSWISIPYFINFLSYKNFSKKLATPTTSTISSD